ncbi:MAG: tetratricopeptide repeat protein [Leptolyngbyaceae cyanobacterium CSU_1_4]|nr:tetratricopeptide repeat protein [Leptolyngbyaceae cyanobacterium CSU_1_4]
MGFLWQVMFFRLALLALTDGQPIDFKETTFDDYLPEKQHHEQRSPVQDATEPTVSDYAQLTVALSVFQELLRFHQTAGNVAEAATVWFRLGDIYQQIDQFSHALSSYQQAIAHYQIIGDVMGEANTLSHLGKAYENQGWFGCALEHYEQALAKLRQNPDYLDNATTLSHLANCIEDMF